MGNDPIAKIEATRHAAIAKANAVIGMPIVGTRRPKNEVKVVGPAEIGPAFVAAKGGGFVVVRGIVLEWGRAEAVRPNRS